MVHALRLLGLGLCWLLLAYLAFVASIFVVAFARALWRERTSHSLVAAGENSRTRVTERVCVVLNGRPVSPASPAPWWRRLFPASSTPRAPGGA